MIRVVRILYVSLHEHGLRSISPQAHRMQLRWMTARGYLHSLSMLEIYLIPDPASLSPRLLPPGSSPVLVLMLALFPRDFPPPLVSFLSGYRLCGEYVCDCKPLGP